MEAMAEALMQEVETYVSLHNNTDMQYIVIRPIMDLCLMAVRRPGVRVSKRWLDQEDIDLEGI